MPRYLMAVAAVLFALAAFSGESRAFIGNGSSGPAGANGELAKAMTAIKGQQYQSAIDILNQLVGSDPRNADIYTLLGYSYRKLKDYDRAERNYTRALRLQPEHKGALEYMGEMYLETNRRDKAAELLARLEDLCPDGCVELDTLRKAYAGGRASSRGW